MKHAERNRHGTPALRVHEARPDNRLMEQQHDNADEVIAGTNGSCSTRLMGLYNLM